LSGYCQRNRTCRRKSPSLLSGFASAILTRLGVSMKLVSVFCAFSTLVLFLARADGGSIFVTDLQGPTPIFSFDGEELCTFVSCGLSPTAGYEVPDVSSVYTNFDKTLSIVSLGMVQDNPVSGVQSLQLNNLEHSLIIDGPGGGTDVPEPSTFALLLVAVFGYRSYMWRKPVPALTAPSSQAVA
jgi:hypothetical protein